MNKFFFFAFFCTMLCALSCSKDGDINIFSIEDDKMLGLQLRDEILANPAEYPVIERADAPDAYAYLDDIVNDILASDDINYKDEFAWETRIIKNDSTLNAFAAPGGYIFVYTGIIKFLEEKDDFVGVMGHEIAHADQRHSTDQLTDQHGIAFLIGLLAGDDPGTLTQVLSSLVTLKFSRSAEAEADKFSVAYLCDTEYAANGAASFFQKLLDQGSGGTPEFLSTHPSPDNRVEDINAEATTLGCDTTFDSDDAAWKAFQDAL